MEINFKGKDIENLVKIFTPDKETFLSKLRNDPEKYLLIQEILLLLVGTGILSMALLMPGLGKSLSAVARAHERNNFRKRMEGLKKKNLVRIYQKNGEEVVEITRDGITTALKYKLAKMQIKKPNKWDGKWRIVTFDVSENKKRMRDLFQRKLREMGFYPLNKSVYVHPYSCFEELEYLRNYYFVGGSVTFITAEKIEGDNDLSSIFHLKPILKEILDDPDLI